MSTQSQGVFEKRSQSTQGFLDSGLFSSYNRSSKFQKSSQIANQVALQLSGKIEASKFNRQAPKENRNYLSPQPNRVKGLFNDRSSSIQLPETL
jgi:hypothetical protein